MTWGMWGSAIRGVSDFVSRYQFVELEFNIMEAGTDMGTGSLLIA